MTHRPLNRILLASLLSCTAFAQPRPLTREGGSIEGRVVSDINDAPLRRARITLRSLEGGVSTVSVDADDTGSFAIRGVAPGRYSLEASRDGYLASSLSLRGGLRMPPNFYLGAENLADLMFRLRPWSVLAGRIRFDDGEPAVGVTIELYRAYRTRGRRALRLAASGATNDRGEYRIYGLPPANYYVAAIYEKAPPAPGVVEQPRTDSSGREVAVLGYTTTFFPDTTRLAEALSVHLEAGQETLGIDIFLKQVAKVKLRGHVTSGLSGQKLGTATITLYRYDTDNQSALATPWKASFDRDGNFTIRDVPPGSYEILVQASDRGQRIEGFRPVLIANEDVDNLELLPSTDVTWSGRIVSEGGKDLAAAVAPRVVLQPRSEFNPTLTPPVRGGNFALPLVAGETYDAFVDGLPEDYYVSAIRAGGTDVRNLGVSSSMASPQEPLRIAVDSRGAKVSGRVFGGDGSVWSGAALALIPDFSQGRLQAFRTSSADEYGLFTLRGVAPGKYTLVAWLDEAPCDFYDPEDVTICRAMGTPVEVTQASEQVVSLQMKPSPRR